MTRQWLPVPVWIGFYECSNTFEVRSLDRWLTRRDGRRVYATGKVLRQYCGSVVLQRPGRREHRCVRALVQAAFGEEAKAT
jgi:hypothetical protein